LFGYDKGAFTDAKSDKKGLFEMAVGGTILLDEIGDMKTGLQSKLLRVLEERTIRRVGGKDDISVDLTVIATTNINLQEAVSKGEFRQDLFFRLSTFYLHVVPLRERQEDIPLLATHFLLQFAGKYKKKKIKGFAPESEKFLLSYRWPGNVRELRNLVERLVVLESAEIIEPGHLPKWLTDQSAVPLSSDMAQGSNFVLPETGISIEEVEKDLIRQALDRSGNNKAEAARLLKVSYDTLRYQIKKYKLE
jgi:transcriptional regulator with PAS, ATPase and Fis domain